MQSTDLATRLNQTCHCLGVPSADALPPLFASEPVFLSASDADTISDVVAAYEALAANQSFRDQVLAGAAPIARHDFGPRGAFMAFDFHPGSTGPQLIEVNTNGGGALLNAAVHPNTRLMATFVEMLEAEWIAQRGAARLRHVAIVDGDPPSQPMYAEFELFKKLFEAHGWTASIADPTELRWRGGKLWLGGAEVDLIYNRLTDFYFEDEDSAGVREAYEAGAVVVTPHPRAHALFADKRNLLRAREHAGATTVLRGAIPESIAVADVPAAELWAARKRYYFKPAGGHGSRGVYRGAKLTRRTWGNLLEAGDYIAQREVPPPRRELVVAGSVHELKFDIRAYSYAGQVQLLAARLYRGQTTNLSTAGGGFAPVVVLPTTPR